MDRRSFIKVIFGVFAAALVPFKGKAKPVRYFWAGNVITVDPKLKRQWDERGIEKLSDIRRKGDGRKFRYLKAGK